MKSRKFNYFVKVGDRLFNIKGLIWPPDRVFKDIPSENAVDYEILDIAQVSGESWDKDPRICGDGTFEDYLELNYNQIERGIFNNYMQEARRS